MKSGNQVLQLHVDGKPVMEGIHLTNDEMARLPNMVDGSAGGLAASTCNITMKLWGWWHDDHNKVWRRGTRRIGERVVSRQIVADCAASAYIVLTLSRLTNAARQLVMDAINRRMAPRIFSRKPKVQLA